ncbi:BEL1-like homeodomain protein 7 isoform X3 [Mangifera indica]|uniref:BEL1-like homeodomain protein 7 isoform X3 n=1 Tax=Mangifera indica TaxID=29780 RepID=UPI001CF9FDBF|nr:BEL1-like homeodomain protein 7 isoform X3 [Mangifera indica]
MATYYTSSNNQRESAPMIYLRDSLPGSYSEAPVLPGNVMMYMNSGSYPDSLVLSSQQQNNCIDIQSVETSESTPQQQEIFSNLGGSRIGEHEFNAWRDHRNEILVMHPMGGPTNILQGEGGRNGSSRDEQARNVEYLPPTFSGGNQENKGDVSPYGMPSVARAIPNSRFLKVAQQLLDEVVNVRKALKQPDGEKSQSTHEQRMRSSKDGGSSNTTSNPQESAGNTPNELSHAEKQELQNKLTKLLSMLDEVDKRYKQYCHQMQIVVSSFDLIAGCGAAKPYTALALQTISCHFRCLRDAITGQIQATRRSLGEQDTSENSKGVGITRLRYVDQQLRQQRALQQLGMMQQHAWRPQRGLPESSVSILRAWLFEHFLHPYPKDSDKIMLARQTGLTRSQVSNWFINARVRLWKPMVEEMYKEEFVEAEMDSNSSSEKAAKANKGDMMTSEDREEDLQQSGSSTATERCSTGQMTDSKFDHVPDVEMAGSSFHNGTRGQAETEYGLLKLRDEQGSGVDECSLFPDPMVHSEGGNDRYMAAAAAAYHMSELGRFGSGSGVSLTLGLQHCEGGNLPVSGGTHHSFVAMRGDDIYSAAASSVGAESAEYECINNGNRQSRFSSSHLLHDFVA